MPLLRPGEGFRPFDVLEKKNGVSMGGRPVADAEYVKKGYFIGCLTDATQKEKETWKQNGHEVSHKVVQELITMEPGEITARPTQYLRYTNESGQERTMRVEGVEHPGGIEHWLVYYVNLRGDLHGNSRRTTGSSKTAD